MSKFLFIRPIVQFYLAIIFVGFTSQIEAQSLSLSAINTTYIDTGFYFQSVTRVHNNSSSNIDVLVEKVQNNLVSGHESHFDWVMAYPPLIVVSPHSYNLPAGSYIDLFQGFLQQNNISGISYVSYCFYDQNNISDSVCVQYMYNGITVSSEMSGSKNFISPAIPNPADRDVTFRYRINNISGNAASLRIFNILGVKVKDVVLSKTNNFVNLNISDLDEGLYLYALYVDGNIISSNKFIVRKN